MKKLVVCLMVLVCLFAVVSSYAEEPEGILAVVHSGSLSMRVEPNASAKRIDNLTNGDLVTIPVDYSGNVWRTYDPKSDEDFIYIYFDGEYGWVMEKLLTKNPRYLASEVKKTLVYALPGVDVQLTDSLNLHEKVLILAEIDSGYSINFRKASGFVKKDADVYLMRQTGQNSWDYYGERRGVLNDEEEFYLEPHPDAYQIAVCSKGEPLRIFGEANGYYKAIWQDKMIYVEMDDVDLY